MSDQRPGPIPAEGAVLDDFVLTDALSPADAPAVIERDRVTMAARPGFHRKLLPFGFDATGRPCSGGRYLFDSYADAERFARWCATEFDYDAPGRRMPDHPHFTDFVGPSVWRVAGAHDVADVRIGQRLLRTRTWHVPGGLDADRLRAEWSAFRDACVTAGLTATWLLYDELTDSVVTVLVRGGRPPDVDASGRPDVTALHELAAADVPTPRSVAGAPVSDLTHWLFTVWFPVIGGESVIDPVWPNSPPLPAPTGSARSAGTTATGPSSHVGVTIVN